MSYWWRLLFVLIVAIVVVREPVFSQADDVTLRIIVVHAEDEAQRIVDRLAKGEDFAVLARRVSIDPTADDGGLIGQVDRTSLRPELRDALQGLGAGQVSPVIKLPTGFAVLKVVPSGEAAASMAGSTVNPGVDAKGSVKYVFGLSGLLEVQDALRQYVKPTDWHQDPRTICELRTKSAAAMQSSLERALSPTAPALEPGQQMQARFTLGQIYAYDGKMVESIEEFQKAYWIVSPYASAGNDAMDAMIRLEEALGTAYLHKAEFDNSVYHQPGDRCLLNAKGIQRFAKTEASEKAIEHFTRYLAHRPGELEVKWLLNLAYMTTGGYPDKVPPEHLIPPASLASGDDIGRFNDVAVGAGLNSFSLAGGVIVDDFNNDGRLDLATSSYDSCAPMRLFMRLEDGTFAEQGAKAGLGDQVGGLNLVQTDYNNDGCLDILLMRGAWDIAQRRSLLRNNCDGTFTDVTVASGLAQPPSATQAAVWTDIDNDGFLDLFIGNEDRAAQLFRNRRDGTFEDIAEKAGVARTMFSKGVGAADYDNDGWPDLYVSNLNGENFLYRNNHDGTFMELAKAAGVPGSGKGFVTWFFDYDNDGHQDLFATSYFTSVDETVRTYLGLPHNATTLKLYRNLGNGGFQDVTAETGLAKVFMPMGSNFGDIDNDGFLDIYLGTGNPSYASLVPSALLRNKDGKSFVDITASSGTGELHKGHGVAFADLDYDGDDELIFEVGGAVPGDAHALRLFENPGHGNDWINLKLVGVKTNRAAIGARIAVTVQDATRGKRTIHRMVTSGGSFGASPLQQHVGLGKAAQTVDVEIWWPTSNTRQRFAGVAKNQTIEIKEFEERYVTLERPRVRLDRSKTGQSSKHGMTGVVLEVDPSRKTFVVSHDSVPGVMAAMTMPFDVRQPKELDGIAAGTPVEFTLVVDRDAAYAEQIRIRRYEGAEQDPFTARRLKLLQDLTASGPKTEPLPVGRGVPDFTLIDQANQPVTLSQFRDKVVAINFVYTNCALPQFCFRIANHFGVLQRRFKDRLSKDLVLLTVTFDPARDRPDTLATYAKSLNADPRAWRFLTGSVEDVRRVCDLFGVESFQDEGLMNHSSHTAVIDRRGTLVANLEGNRFTATQLGDLVDTVLKR